MNTPIYIIRLTRDGERWYLTRQDSPLGVTFDKTHDLTIATKFSGISAGGMLILARNRWPDHEAELVKVELPGTAAPTDRANVPPQPSDAPKADERPQTKSHRELDPVVTAYFDQFMDLTWRDALAQLAQDRIVKLSAKHGTVEQRARLAITTAALEEPIRVAVQTYQRLLRRPSERARWYCGWLPPSEWARQTAKQVRGWLAALGLLVKIVDCQDGKGRHVLAFELVGLGQITPQDLWDMQALVNNPNEDDFRDEDEDDDDESEDANPDEVKQFIQAARETILSPNGDQPNDEGEARRRHHERSHCTAEEAHEQMRRMNKPHSIPDDLMEHHRQSARDQDEITPQDAADDLAATQKILDKIAQERRAARNTAAALDKPDGQP